MSEPTVPPFCDVRDQPLRLALRFAQGHGRLVASPWATAGLKLTRLVLALPGLRFPCDVSGGVERFRDHPSSLHELAVSLTAADLTSWLNRADLAAVGLGAAHVELHDGYLAVVGSLLHADGAAETPYRICLGLFVSEARKLTLIFYNLCVFGHSPLTVAALAPKLHQSLAPLLPPGCVAQVHA